MTDGLKYIAAWPRPADNKLPLEGGLINKPKWSNGPAAGDERRIPSQKGC